uniref:HECT-type E3 ubiquitin transferase n=1 Tax=Ananas comosus var. bracteatus TaxID=296719 RepID=A0A6V7PKR4_ANACO|nr:unnamed protein product [Ananas comosus var. bracteatus]
MQQSSLIFSLSYRRCQSSTTPVSRRPSPTSAGGSDLRFLHRGRQLSPDATLAAAGVQPGDTLHLSPRLHSIRRPKPGIGHGDFEDLHFFGATAMLVRPRRRRRHPWILLPPRPAASSPWPSGRATRSAASSGRPSWTSSRNWGRGSPSRAWSSRSRQRGIWCSCCCRRKVFSPDRELNVLFLACPSDRRRFFPNPASSTDSMNLEYFKFSGRLIALALMHEVQIGITFDRTFFLQLAGKPITLEDVKDADPFLYLSCKWILDMDPDLVDSDALGLTFSRDVEVLGSIKNAELGTGGKDTVVNRSNREYYVNLLIKHSFVTSVAYQVEQFARGFADILSDRTHQRLFFESLELEDVDRLLYGSNGAVSLTDWKEHTKYECYKEKMIRYGGSGR